MLSAQIVVEQYEFQIQCHLSGNHKSQGCSECCEMQWNAIQGASYRANGPNERQWWDGMLLSSVWVDYLIIIGQIDVNSTNIWVH